MKPQDSMKDWPKSLKINHEAIMLAPLLYKAACAIYGGVAGEFSELVPRIRQRFIEDAAEVLAHDRRVDRTPLQFVKAPAVVAEARLYVPTRGIMPRCCRDSLEGFARDGAVNTNGETAWCRFCAGDLFFRNGAWEKDA